MQEQIKILRDEIDGLDSEIIHLISERFQIAKGIIKIKESHSEKVHDQKREEEIISRLIEISDLPPEVVRNIFSSILENVKKYIS